MVTLTEKEERLVQTIRALPPQATDQILGWASRLAELAQGKPVEWSDSWTEEDIRDATTTSLRNFDSSESPLH